MEEFKRYKEVVKSPSFDFTYEELVTITVNEENQGLARDLCYALKNFTNDRLKNTGAKAAATRTINEIFLSLKNYDLEAKTLTSLTKK